MEILRADDIRVFSDIGSPFEVDGRDGGHCTFRLIMNGEKVVISMGSGSGAITLSRADEEISFAGPKALLASADFGDLRRWSANQSALLMALRIDNPVKVVGEFIGDFARPDRAEVGLDEFDTFLSAAPVSNLHVVVIDGPAGIGKTTQIRQLAFNRASRFGRAHERLILHVESRGRILQNINDLIAASLQTIRAKPTYDQLAVLVRHGLVTLVIDGFDELADPNGYQLAWAQLNDLLENVVGAGQVILAGRETFVSPGRMQNALQVLSSEGVLLSSYQLREVSPDTARKWLRSCGWSEDLLGDERLRELIAPNSYALRPFFLVTLADSDIFSRIVGDDKVDLLALLVDALISREASKFGDDILRAIGYEGLVGYIRTANEEIARDMADNQGEVLPGQTISWIAEIALPEKIDPQIGRALVHRAVSMPFLVAEPGRNAIRFAHRQYFVFFLGLNAVRTVSSGEIPKYLRRNILGAEFLENFGRVLRDLSPAAVDAFVNKAEELLPSLNAFDRSAGNVAATLIASCCEREEGREIVVRGIGIDEAYFYNKPQSIVFRDVVFSSIYAPDADLSQLTFGGECTVVSLHANDDTRLPASFPFPQWLEMDGQGTINKPEDVRARVGLMRGDGASGSSPRIGFSLDLLGRILRYRAFWLREMSDNEDPSADKILQDPDWPTARAWLENNDLARFEERQPSSGRPAIFIHFRADKIREMVRG